MRALSRRHRTATTSLVLLVFTACGQTVDAVSPSVDVHGPGVLSFSLQSPSGDDAAFWLSVRGGAIDSADAPGFKLLVLSSTDEGAQLLVRGALGRESPLRLWVRERAMARAYAVTVDAAITRGTYKQRSVEGYRVAPRR